MASLGCFGWMFALGVWAMRLVVVLVLWQLVLGPRAAFAQQVPVQGQGQQQAQDITNPQVEATFVDHAEDELVIHTTDVPVGILSTIQGWGINFFTTTPLDLTTDNGNVRAVWLALAIVAEGALGANVLWTALKIVHAPWSGARPVRDLWLVAFAAIGAMVSLLFCREVIELNNILCLAGGSADPKDLFLARPDSHGGLAILVAGLIFEIVAVFVAIKLVVRMAMVMALVAVSGPGFYAWTQPETKWLGQLWLYGFVGWTLGQFLTVTVLKLGLNLTRRIDPNSGTGTTISAYVLGIMIMLLAYGLPDLIARYAGARTGVPGVLSTAGALAWSGMTRAVGAAAAGAAGSAASGARSSGYQSSGWTNSATRKAATFVPGGIGPQHH